MQPEGELDDVGDALVGHALALLVFECVGVAARCQKALLEMLDTPRCLGATGLQCLFIDASSLAMPLRLT